METFDSNIAALHLLLYCLGLVSIYVLGKLREMLRTGHFEILNWF